MTPAQPRGPLVEVFFYSLERFRAIATRFETARQFLAHVACINLWLA